MRVEVRLYCGLERCVPGITFGQPIMVEITGGFTGKDLLKKINVPEEKAFIILVNGLHKDLDAVLSEGDRVSIFPAVGGG